MIDRPGMMDQRIIEMIEGRMIPGNKDVSLLERVISQELPAYDEVDQKKILELYDTLVGL